MLFEGVFKLTADWHGHAHAAMPRRDVSLCLTQRVSREGPREGAAQERRIAAENEADEILEDWLSIALL
jgi:hypothetical protein